jgi:hypothetical protein
MTESKPKYVRKKCEHDKYSFQCKECNGASLCIHKKQKHICKECSGKGICPHQRIKSNCVECKGGSICDHNKRRSRCKECKGGSICPHKKLKTRCVDCNGNSICIHKIRKEHCVDCKGSAICLHQIRRSRCIECKGSELCMHNNYKSICVECQGSNICEHNKLYYQCVECQGYLICEHNKRKSLCSKCEGSYICSHQKQKNQCVTCTPSSGCHHCHIISIINSKWKPYCFRCYCVLNPDAIIPRKYKLKEHHVVDSLKTHFKEQITMIFDKPIEGGCSKKRPDVSIDLGSHCLMIEIDENRHMNYSCEERRMTELYEDVGFRKIIFIRFNPDGYKEGINKYTSPFRYTRSGILHLEEAEFNRRIQKLIERIHIHRITEPLEQITVEYLFYGDET